MSNNPGPAAGQVWGSRLYVDDFVVVVRPAAGIETWWEVSMLRSPETKYDTPLADVRYYARWATPAECRAAGLDPAVVWPKPEWVRVLRYCAQGSSPVRRVLEWNEMGRPIVESACEGNEGRWELVSDDQWEPASAPPPTPDARVVELEAELAAVKAELAEMRESRENQRKRAEASEAECARLKATPAPAPTPTLTPEDVAFIHAQQVVWDRSDNVLFMDTPERLECRDKARNAIAARAKGA